MTIEPLLLAFEQFKRDQAPAFERIAKKTRGTHDAEDLKSEAWFIAREIGTRRGCRMDLFNRAEQDMILAWLYKRFVDFVDGKRKESIDQESNSESLTWHDRLAAPEESDPLLQLARLDEEQPATVPMKGFSQYSAYMILLKRCEMNLFKLAEYLAVSFLTLRKRIQDAQEYADMQPSLFDDVEKIDPQFIPRVGWIRQLWSSWRSRSVRAQSFAFDKRAS